MTIPHTNSAGPAGRPAPDHGSTSAENLARRTARDPHTGAPVDPAELSLGETIAAATENLSNLIRNEVALAKAEATESAKNAGKGAGMFGGAGAFGLVALIFLSLAIAWGLGSLGMGLGWGSLIVAVLWAIVAAVLALQGKKNITNVGMPQTQDTAARIPGALKGEETR